MQEAQKAGECCHGHEGGSPPQIRKRGVALGVASNDEHVKFFKSEEGPVKQPKWSSDEDEPPVKQPTWTSEEEGEEQAKAKRAKEDSKEKEAASEESTVLTMQV